MLAGQLMGHVVLSSGSQSMFPGSATSASPRNLLEMQILRPFPDPQNQNPWGWGPAMCIVMSSPGDPNACSHLKPIIVDQCFSQ